MSYAQGETVTIYGGPLHVQVPGEPGVVEGVAVGGGTTGTYVMPVDGGHLLNVVVDDVRYVVTVTDEHLAHPAVEAEDELVALDAARAAEEQAAASFDAQRHAEAAAADG